MDNAQFRAFQSTDHGIKGEAIFVPKWAHQYEYGTQGEPCWVYYNGLNQYMGNVNGAFALRCTRKNGVLWANK
jgi:hypothetical protein